MAVHPRLCRIDCPWRIAVVRPRCCQRGCSNETIPARELTLTTHSGSVKVPGSFAKTAVRFAGEIIFADGAVGMLLLKSAVKVLISLLLATRGFPAATSSAAERRCRRAVRACSRVRPGRIVRCRRRGRPRGEGEADVGVTSGPADRHCKPSPWEASPRSRF